MELLNGLFLVSGFAYGLGPNAYAVRGPEGVVLIDSGVDENDLRVIDANMVYWGMDSGQVSHLLLTHEHFDHSGNAQLLKERGAVIVASTEAASAIEAGDNRTADYAFQQRFPPCRVDVKVNDNDSVDAGGLTFGVIHVPGHSRGSVIYTLRWEERVVLFTGDVVRVGADCASGRLGWSGAVDYDRETYLRSLERISKLDCDVVLGGHFQPCLVDGWKILQDTYKVALLEWRPPATYE